MGEFSLDTLQLKQPDTWELLGNPTDTLVAETVVRLADDDFWDNDLQYKEMALEDLLDALIENEGVAIGEALRRVAKAIEAGEVTAWEFGRHMVCVNKHVARRLKARWAFNLLLRWANEGTARAVTQISQAKVRLSEPPLDPDSHKGFQVFADELGLSRRKAYRILHSDGFDERFARPYRSPDETKARMGQRVVGYVRWARDQRDHQQTLDR